MSANDKVAATFGPCNLGPCAAEHGHTGTCAQASGWDEPRKDTMTATRQARDLCARDIGRTIACYDTRTGDSITSTIQGIDHTTERTWAWVQGRNSAVQLRHEQTVNITGAASPNEEAA